MTEKMHGSEKPTENISLDHEIQHNLQKLQERAASAEHAGAHIENVREKVEQQAISKDHVRSGGESAPTQAALHGHYQVQKAHAYRSSIQRIQRKLPKALRPVSKIMHDPKVEAVNEVASKTIARSNGLLWGGLLMFVGSCFFYYFSKHYGFEYNYLIGILLFIAGYVLATLFDLARFLLRKD